MGTTSFTGTDRAALNALRAKMGHLTEDEEHAETCDALHDGARSFSAERCDCSCQESNEYRPFVNAWPHIEAALGEMEQALWDIQRVAKHDGYCFNQRNGHPRCICGLAKASKAADAVLARYALPAEREESAT